MWSTRLHSVANGQLVRFVHENGSASLSYGDALSLMQESRPFRDLIVSVLSQMPYDAFRWETPPISLASTDRAFEFVVLESPGLDRSPDFSAFEEHFRSANSKTVLAFPNLGNDATLVVPSQHGPVRAYGHLAAFVRGAPDEQKDSLWQLVAAETKTRIGALPIWLSTAGAGVPWLHVRIDSAPKYYCHRPYRQVR